jgi:uncharacterized glyoxalase superfamily protein PhnB
MSMIIPTFRYDDVPAAIAFLQDALGFTTHELHQRDGVVHHAELKLGDDYIMLGQNRPDAPELAYGGSTTYVVVDDVDARHARAVAAGAEIVRELEDMDYGSREFAAKDPGGNVWSFGTYAPQG